jgi:hypothetical protein
MAAAEDPLAERRCKILMESLDSAHEKKFGYFGISGPLCIGDNSMGIRLVRKPKDDSDDRPTHNMLTNPVKKGCGKDVYFSFAPPLCAEKGSDPYVDPSKINAKGKVRHLADAPPFKPARATGQKTFSSVDREGNITEFSTNKLGYAYVPHMDNVKNPKEIYEKYKGVLPPPNIKCQPLKKGGAGCLSAGVLCGYEDKDKERHAFPVWHAEPYDNARILRKKEIAEHKAKEQEKSFKGMCYGNEMFHPNSEVYHEVQPTHIPREPRPFVCKRAEHDRKFCPANPSKKGALLGTFDWTEGEQQIPFPKWMPDPPKETKRKPKEDGDKKPFAFGAAPVHMHNPMSSVVTNMRNMRNERPSAFARPRF